MTVYLTELFDIPGELNWSRLDVYEILDSKIKITWTQSTEKIDGKFEVDGVDYTIELESGTFKQYNFINISFYRGDQEYELDLNTKSPAKVLGAIINGVLEKLSEFHYDAIVFAAANNVEKRMSFYNKLASRFKKNFAQVIENVDTKNGKFTILMASTIKKTEREDLVKHVKSNTVKS